MTAAPGVVLPARSRPLISVVICTYTAARADLLDRALASVAAQTQPAHETILVVDHAPGLLERLRREHPDVTVIPNVAAPGLSGGRNTGLAAASGDLVAFLDDDAEADLAWLARLGAVFHDPAVVGAGGAAVPVWEGGRPTWFPPQFDWVVGCSHPGLPAKGGDVRNVLGCNMAFRRDALAAVGGFDARLGRVRERPIGAEETELCIRLRSAMPESRIRYVPSAIVRHHVPAARGRWSYFIERCTAEGWSKAVLSRLVGSRDGLASERRYVLRTLPRAVLRGVADGLTGDLSGLARSATIVAGTAATSAAYLAALRKLPADLVDARAPS